MASKQHILRLIDAGGEVRRAPLVGVQFLHEPAVKIRLLGQAAVTTGDNGDPVNSSSLVHTANIAFFYAEYRWDFRGN